MCPQGLSKKTIKLNMIRLLIIALVPLFFTSCQQSFREKGSRQIVLFDNELVHFSPETYQVPADLSLNDLVRIQDGRIILRKVELPAYEREARATLTITFSSEGDPWDKSGSCFLIPAGQEKNILSIFNGEFEFPEAGEEVEGFRGIVGSGDFKPAVELMRFMTPFGAISERTRNRRPVYIPRWEEQVTWTADITDRLPLMEGEFWIGIWADTWTSEGYRFSAELTIEESPFPCAGKTPTEVLPLLNTIYYVGGQRHVDIFARKDLEVQAYIPENARNVKLYYITTGHGGHAGGDEFVKKENIIYLNGEQVYRFLPWRDDCASFRRFNPSSGVWLRQDTAYYLDPQTRSYQSKVIEERIASSDLSRSNWCPGSMVEPEVILLKNIEPGENTLTFSIPEAQEAHDPYLNHWLVSAWLVWETR